MSIRIWKFDLPDQGLTTVRSGTVVRWLAVGWQGPQLVAWAEVLPDEDATTSLYVAQTGWTPPEAAPHQPPPEFVGTAQLALPDGGHYVAHVYRIYP